MALKDKYLNEEEKRKVINRLSKISGQINGLKTMIESDRNFDDVMMQLSSSEKAVRSTSAVLFQSYVKAYMNGDINSNEEDVLEKIADLFKKY